MDRQQAIVPNDDILVQLIETKFRTDDRGATSRDAWLLLPELIESFGELGCGVVEMVLADHRQLGALRCGAMAEHPPLA